MSRKKQINQDVEYDDNGLPIDKVAEALDVKYEEIDIVSRRYDAEDAIAYCSKTPDELLSDETYGTSDFTLADVQDLSDKMELRCYIEDIRKVMRELVILGRFVQVKRGHYTLDTEYEVRAAKRKAEFEAWRSNRPNR